jgi:hypothetical protein
VAGPQIHADPPGTDGKTRISLTPKYLLAGPELEGETERLLTSIYAADVADVNAWAGKLNLLVEPRLMRNQWFEFAEPARGVSIIYGYLTSAQGAQIQRA